MNIEQSIVKAHRIIAAGPVYILTNDNATYDVKISLYCLKAGL